MAAKTEAASSGKVLATGVGLLLLAGVSFALSFVHLGRLALPIALAIAALKAGLVIAIFMELSEERSSIRLAALAAILTLSLLVSLTAADVLTRERPPLLPPAPEHVTR
jgi:cytochrome c oxidase subunit 4